MRYKFRTGKDLLEICAREDIPISEAALCFEIENGEMDREQVIAEMDKNLATMEESIRQGLEEENISTTSLTGEDADRLLAFKGDSLMGSDLTIMTASAMAVVEVNASMGRIVAAPTAGASGVLPGVVIGYCYLKKLPREKMLAALFNAAAVGIIIARNASLSGASGGCQAEVGSGAAMAASALTELRGGTPEQCLHAAAMTLKNLLGLVCDPVAGLVECPCIKRNAMGAVDAVLCSDMVMAGITSIIPFDEVVEAMRNVGRMMHPDLRETARGGLADTPTARKIEEELRIEQVKA